MLVFWRSEWWWERMHGVHSSVGLLVSTVVEQHEEKKIPADAMPSGMDEFGSSAVQTAWSYVPETPWPCTFWLGDTM